MDLNKILIDFHGVLTSGKINITADGKTQYETVHVKDIAAIRELIARGWEVYIVTSSDCPIIDAFANKVGCVKITSRIKDSVITMMDKYVAVGDSAFDITLLAHAEKAFCPADASLPVKMMAATHVLDTKAGDGCIEEILHHLIY